MNKATVVATCLLFVLVGVTGHYRHNKELSNTGWVNVSGVAMRSLEPADFDKAALAPAIAQMNEDMRINGKPVIVIQSMPFVPPKLAAIDGGNDGLSGAERKEAPARPHPLRPSPQGYAAIDGGDDGLSGAERKEAPARPHPLRPVPQGVVKARVSHSLAAIVD